MHYQVQSGTCDMCVCVGACVCWGQGNKRSHNPLHRSNHVQINKNPTHPQWHHLTDVRTTQQTQQTFHQQSSVHAQISQLTPSFWAVDCFRYHCTFEGNLPLWHSALFYSLNVIVSICWVRWTCVSCICTVERWSRICISKALTKPFHPKASMFETWWASWVRCVMQTGSEKCTTEGTTNVHAQKTNCTHYGTDCCCRVYRLQPLRWRPREQKYIFRDRIADWCGMSSN